MAQTQLSVGTFNLLNLNEPGIPIYTDQDGWSQEEYDRKIEWTARNLRSLHPDVFAFEELWHPKSIANALEKAGMDGDYDVLTPPGASGKKIVCAAIVRKGLLTGHPEWIENFDPKYKLRSSGDDAQTDMIDVNIGTFSRPVLHFTIKPRSNEADIHVYVCHLKSKLPTQISKEDYYRAEPDTYKKHANGLGSAISTIRRTAEAAALRWILTDLMKGTHTPVIVLGDLNDGQYSNTLNILTEQPNYLVGDSRGGGDTSLYTAQTLQEYRNTRDVYYTHIYKDIMESLDHILVSEEFYDNSLDRIWLFDGMTVNNDHLNFDDHKESGTNDHGIVCATFKHKPVTSTHHN